MSYTYSGNPASSPCDEVHFLLGDTDPSNVLATDEECIYALCQNRYNPFLAAADVAETKALSFVNRKLSPSTGRTTARDEAQAFLTLAATLRMRASVKTATLYAGGLSESEKTADRGSADLTQPFARKHLHEMTPHHLPSAAEEERLA